MDALFCYAGFLWLYRLSFVEVLNEKVQFVKEKSGFPDGLPGREVLRKQISGHVRDGFGALSPNLFTSSLWIMAL